MSITPADIANLRARTGAGMMDCKAALEEANGEMEKAIEILRQKGVLKAAKRADKIAAQGLVASYIHNGKIGVLLEVNCETDFVARTEPFKQLSNDLAMHIAAQNPKYLSPGEIPSDVLEKEKEIYREQLQSEKKPAEIIEKIIEGKLQKFYSEVCLLDQLFVKDDKKTVSQLLAEKTGEMGEKIAVRRFVRYELGEGVEKQAGDFIKEVEEQMK